jgi:hypothetical protein
MALQVLAARLWRISRLVLSSMALDRQEVRKTITHQKDAEEYVSVENE